ncbi:hypothetical protein [uncultured Clostridium sp.]|jgi:hypothetical protein|uniref:hypothetical protein n=1 Tax=uncultured Clostridium sp. TaxID=59620 RepID=UPI002621BFA2|nr:hypothetical protein [uncultured Clostridium sp.]
MSLLSFQVDIKIAKIIIFIDLLYIPVLIILLSYIFLRSDNMDFKYIKIKMGIVGAIYTCVIIIFEPIYKLSIEYGYTVQMSKNILFRGIYISLFVYFLIHAILVKLNKSTNMIGLNFIAITMCVFIFENLVLLVVQNYMPYCLVGELFLAGTLIFGLKTFKS